MRKIIFLFILILFFQYAYSYEDLSKKRIKRVITLAPNITEIFYYLELEKYIVGTVKFSIFPEQAKYIERVGNINLDYEKILSLNPDIIFVLKDFTNIKDINTLKDYSLKVVVLDTSSFSKVIDTMKQLCNIFHDGNLSKIKDLETILKEAINSKTKKKRVYFQIWSKPLMTIGNNTIINELITLAGGKNIYSESNILYPQSNIEYIIEKNPEYIFICQPVNSKTEKEQLRSVFELTEAYKNDKIFFLDPNKYTRPGPEIFKGLLEMKNILSK